MHKSNHKSSRKRILILAAAALLAAPALSLPNASAAPALSASTDSSSSSAPATQPLPEPADWTVPEPTDWTVPEPTDWTVPEPTDWTLPEPSAPAVDAAETVVPPAADPAPASPKPAASSPGTPAVKEPFYDIAKDPNREAIMMLYNEGIVKAAKDRKFRPKAEIGRADFSVILGRAMNAKGSIFDVYFKDPIPDWAIRYVGGLSAAGIYGGYLEGINFGSKQPVTRAEAVAMVARAAHLESQPLPEGLGGVGNIPLWALDDVGAAYAAGLIEVTSTGTLNPNKKVTRSEMAAMIAPLVEAQAFMTPFTLEEDITLP
ncbi:S-layer homology domain-containing protein [Saccharibacillus kuerlensis]|uniref:SLH domain-containing protein n=1 Tax=Saccharibacillus kuerlensis TaxID=459527 RepID=A0ABQ2KZZ8_9BACL|nr:S-layer homology domain-containing protein [Saccharibacillus kuerlensis]GGN98042.1 hypothetical protein GCM10010969_16620 [Saccharibacillus kuerlensis]